MKCYDIIICGPVELLEKRDIITIWIGFNFFNVIFTFSKSVTLKEKAVNCDNSIQKPSFARNIVNCINYTMHFILTVGP